jgi:hypothetical protein
MLCVHRISVASAAADPPDMLCCSSTVLLQGSEVSQAELLFAPSKPTAKGSNTQNGYTSVQATCTEKQPQQQDAGAITQEVPAAAQPAGPQGGLDPTLACCLGAAPQPGAAYDVSRSGPPLPGCEAERCVKLTGPAAECVLIAQQQIIQRQRRSWGFRQAVEWTPHKRDM